MEMNYDVEVRVDGTPGKGTFLTMHLQELHAIEEELHAEILPGTEIMADVGSHHFVKGGSHVLVPQPSADPHDPLVCSPI
jgi:hypothetical protein